MRRKPRITYKSPSEGASSAPFTIPIVTHNLVSSSSISKPHFSKLSPLINNVQLSQRRWLSSISPPLPLYHPLGRFALSLPPLDPTSIGLPCPAGLDDTIRRSSSRARRPAAKLRDEEEISPAIPTAITEPEEKEKPSPRKRRAGGGGVSKRKRKEGDDDDATYPAKRTRLPRVTNQNQALEEDSLAELTVLVADGMSTPEPAPEDRQPERRSTRSRGMVRRDSSASDADTSVGTGFKKEVALMNVESKLIMEGHSQSDDGRNEKEEGELSEESRPNHGIIM